MDYLFRVGYNGLLYASSATIAGNITATSGTIGGCSIKNNVLQIANANINSIDAGKITSGTINADRIGSGTITADKIAIGDFTNYANLNEKTASKYGFTTVQDDSALGNPWFQLNTLKRDVPITPNAYEEYNCNGGESFKIEGEVYSTVTGKKYKESTNVETLQIGIGLYGKKENGDAYWLVPFFSLAENNGKLNAYVTLDNAVRKFGINIQINGTSDFSGILKVRNIKVTRMTDNSLIVNGSITSNKITTDNIAGTNGWINLRSGLFDYGNGKLKWDGTSLSITGNGKFAGEITATSGKIGKYTIDDYLITGSGSTCTGIGGNHAFWAGSDSSNEAPFHVSYDGSLYASKANISGVINSTEGSIGGWNIVKNSINSSYSNTDTTEYYVSDSFYSLSILSDSSKIISEFDEKKYSDSSKQKILSSESDSLTISGDSIQGTSKYTLYGEETDKSGYSFLLSAYNGLEILDEVSEEGISYTGNHILFTRYNETVAEITEDKINSCHAGEVCHYYGNDYGECGTNNDKYYDLSAFTTGGGQTFGSFHTKISNKKIKINRTGVYCFQVKFSVNSGVKGSADKRVEFVPFVNNTRQSRYAALFSSRGNFSITNFQTYILSLNKGDVIAFDISPIEKVSVRVQIVDISVHVLDYVNKYAYEYN